MTTGLTDIEQLCLNCPVPFGCNERDPRCLYRLALGSNGRREDKCRILAFLAENGGAPSRIIAEQFGWKASETFYLLNNLNRDGFVRRIEEGAELEWRLR